MIHLAIAGTPVAILTAGRTGLMLLQKCLIFRVALGVIERSETSVSPGGGNEHSVIIRHDEYGPAIRNCRQRPGRSDY